MIYQNKKIKRITILVIFIFIFINVLTIKKVYSEDSVSKVLILYDEYKEYGEKENILNYINKLALSSKRQVNIVKLSNDNLENLPSYEAIFILCCKENTISNEVRQSISEYKGKIYWFGKNFNNITDDIFDESRLIYKKDNVTYINNLGLISSEYNEIYNTINSDLKLEKINENLYFYFDDVNPFIDLNDLVDKIDYLRDLGITFFIEVSPVFVNENLEAMNRFTEVLRYAQVNGGKIVLGLPTIIYEDASERKIILSVNKGFENYINYCVYPVALDVGEYTLYKEGLKNLLESSNTLFLEANSKEIGILDLSNYKEGPYDNVIQKVDLSYGEFNYKSLLLNNVAIKVSNKLNLSDFEKRVNHYIDKGIIFKNTKSLECKIKISDIEVKSNNKGIFLNNQLVTQTKFINSEEYKKSILKDKDFNYDKKSIDLTKTNSVVNKIVVGICFMLFVIIIISKRINKNKFFKSR